MLGPVWDGVGSYFLAVGCWWVGTQLYATWVLADAGSYFCWLPMAVIAAAVLQ